MKAFKRKSGNKNKNTPGNTGSDFFQAKLQVGQPGDQYEQEADAMADQVVQMNASDQGAWASQPLHQEETEESVQKSPVTESATPAKPLAESVTPVSLSEAEEEPLQKKESEEDLLQNQEGEALQATTDPGENIETEEGEAGSLQMKSDQPSFVSPDMESQIAHPTGGSEMDDMTRSGMESSFGADFSQVKIHTDQHAVQMSRSLGAQAFTHGNDIYFNEGNYKPSADSGRHLLAHELTHTLQQGSSTAVQGKIVQKEGDELMEEQNQTEFGLPDGTTIETSSSPGQMILPLIHFPRFKNRNADRFPPNMELRKGKRPSTDQRPIWRREMNESVTSGLDEKLNEARTQFGLGNDDNIYYFLKPTNGKPLRVFGTRALLLENSLIPFWDREGNPATFQVDHINEDQLGGDDDIYNYELLEATANGSAGPTIAGEIRSRIKGAIEAVEADPDQASEFDSAFPYGTSAEEITRLKSDYDITFTSREFTKEVSGNPDVYWGALEFVDNPHLELLQVMSPAEMQEEGLQGGNPDHLMIFPGSAGGLAVQLPWGSDQPAGEYVDLSSSNIQLFAESRIALFGASFNPVGLENSGNVGFLRVEAFKSDGSTVLQVAGNSTFDWTLDPIPGLEYGGAINKESVAGSVRNSLRLPGLSPIRMDYVSIDPAKGLMATGKVLPTVPLVQDADIDLVIEGDNIRLRKIFNTGELNFPSPFNVSDSSLEIFMGTEGLGAEGNINFGINQVGEGHISATASTAGGFELEGVFNFDSDLFDPAAINVEYKENTWTIGGEIGIHEGKVRGVKSATITASYSENTFSATGEAELDMPGIERGNMDIQYGAEGFSIGGNFDLSSDIPGIRGGNVEARVAKPDGAEAYDILVSGTAQPDIPGISTSLTVTYENGALTIEGSAAYSRGMLSGTLEVGATNRPIGEEGQPIGEPDENMRVYGGGELTLQLTPWLAATAGVRLLPNGEIEVNARLSSDSYEVFRRREINRNLFRVPTIEIPLFAIPLGPRSIGLVAQIGGGLDFTAGFGPGELRNLSAEITYNPEREEETTVAGHGEFAIPADAGLTLRGDLGLGVSVAIASLSGGIELTGTLGLEGEALAEVDVNWSPQTGLALDASGRITVNPKFIFEINAFARASLGIGFLSVSETWRHNLAAYEWGPGIQFGIVFPVHYREGEPFDMSFDDIEVIYPDLDVIDMAKGLASDIKNDLFA